MTGQNQKKHPVLVLTETESGRRHQNHCGTRHLRFDPAILAAAQSTLLQLAQRFPSPCHPRNGQFLQICADGQARRDASCARQALKQRRGSDTAEKLNSQTHSPSLLVNADWSACRGDGGRQEPGSAVRARVDCGGACGSRRQGGCPRAAGRGRRLGRASAECARTRTS